MSRSFASATALAALLAAAQAVPALAGPLAETRLAPPEIQALTKVVAGAGTSGLSGIRTTVLAGQPTEAGPYTIALRVPPHTTIAAHTHADDRTAVVVAGEWWFGYGPVNEQPSLKRLPAGSFYSEPAGLAHFARTGARPAVVYITGVGPTDTRYVEASAASAPR